MTCRTLFILLGVSVLIAASVGTPIICGNAQYKVMAVVIASYNNEKWCIKNLESALMQDYPTEFVKIIIINDRSTDRTYELLEKYVADHGLQDRVILINNQERKGALANLYRMIHEFCEPTDVVLTLDGDDWFAQNGVLQIINKAYQNPNVWLTYGQFREWPTGRIGFCQQVPEDILRSGMLRQVCWLTSHLRTFYAGLFWKIKDEDFLFDGEFYPMAWDMAMMFPMIEMARERIKFIPDVCYSYNMTNPISDFRKDFNLSQRCDKHIRSRQPCPRLEKLFDYLISFSYNPSAHAEYTPVFIDRD